MITVCYHAERLRSHGPTLLLAVPAEQASRAQWDGALSRALLGQDRIGFVLRDTDLAVVRANVRHGAFAGPGLLRAAAWPM